MEKYICEQFTLTGHSGLLNDVPVTLTDKIDSKNPSKQEDCTRTKASLGLDIKEGL